MQQGARTPLMKNLRISSQIQQKPQAFGGSSKIGANPPPQRQFPSQLGSSAVRNIGNGVSQPVRALDRQNTINNGQGDSRGVNTQNTQQINQPLQKGTTNGASFLIRKTNVNANSNKSPIISNNPSFLRQASNSTNNSQLNERQKQGSLMNPPKIQSMPSTSSNGSDQTDTSLNHPQISQRQQPTSRPTSHRILQNTAQNTIINPFNQNRILVPQSPQQSNSISNNTVAQNVVPEFNATRSFLHSSRTESRTQQEIDQQSQLQSPSQQRINNELQNLNSTITQTNNSLRRVAHIPTIIPDRTGSIANSLPQNQSIDILQQDELEKQRELENLNVLKRQREQAALERQRFDQRMAQSNRIVRQDMRQDYRNRNGRSMSLSSDEEERKEDISISEESIEPRRPRPISRIHNSDTDSDNEEERKEDRGNARRQVAASMPPVRNIGNNTHQLQFGRQNRNDQGSQTNQQRLAVGFNLGQNRNEPNRNNQPDQEEPQSGENQRTFRLVIPLSQFANINGNSGNQRNITDGLRTFVDMMNNRLGRIQGEMTNSNIEELAQIFATIRFLQGVVQQQRGLTADQIKEFPVVTLKQVDQDEICSICLEDWKINDKAKLLGCMHKFHSHCIESWLQEKTICPNCKQDQREFFSDKIPESLQEKN